MPAKVFSESSGRGFKLEPRDSTIPVVDVGVRRGSSKVEVTIDGATMYSVIPGARKPSLQFARTNNDCTGVQDTPYFGTVFEKRPLSS